MFRSRILSAKRNSFSFQQMAKHDSGKSGNGPSPSVTAGAAGLAPYLIMAAAESGSGGRQKSAILAGACEAVIAALYLDGGLEAAKGFVLRYWDEALTNLKPELRDAKTALQEWAQSGAL